jgi:aminoglycoside phosphotransferase (APT) family kinase protein
MTVDSIHEAHAIGPPHANTGLLFYFDELSLQCFAGCPGFRKSSRLNHDPLDAAPGTVSDRLDRRQRRYKNDSQVHRVRNLENRIIAGQSFNFLIARVNRINPALITRDQVFQDTVPAFELIGGCPDECNAFGFEKKIHSLSFQASLNGEPYFIQRGEVKQIVYLLDIIINICKETPMKDSENIGNVRRAHRFDENKLCAYLEKELTGFSGKLEVRQFGYGQSNPTYLLVDTSNHKEYVLRKKPPGKLLPSAHAVDREYRILRALHETDVPVPETVVFCEDTSVVGTPFFIMERIKGRIFRDAAASEASDSKERSDIFDAMNDTLAKIHRVDWQAVGLETFGKPGNYMARQVSKWSRQYIASKTDPIESMDRLIEWLSENIPEDTTPAIVHGDFRLENLIFHLNEPRVLAVLDWELSTLGHPLADLAYSCMGYHIPALGSPALGLSGIDFAARGIPTESEFVAAYCNRIGRKEIPSWTFFVAFSLFRLAAIVQGVYRRGLDGIASAANAKTYGAYVKFLAEAAWNIIQGR